MFKDCLDSNFLDCCWRARLPDWTVDLGKTIGAMFDVVNITLAFELVIVMIKLSSFQCKEQLLNLFYEVHHLLILPMCTVVGFYLIFKQRRPCFDCKRGCQIGNVYGMPSGDALYATVIGCFTSRSSHLIGALIIVAVCYSRVSKGYHSILQILVGAAFGWIAYFLQMKTDDTFKLVNWIVGLILPTLVLFDPVLKCQRAGNYYNLHAWLFLDTSTLMFDFFVCPPERYNVLSFCPTYIPIVIFYSLFSVVTTISTYMIENGISLSLV